MLRRFSLTGTILVVLALLALSDRVSAAHFGAAAPLVHQIQLLGGTVSIAAERLLGTVFGQVRAAGFPFPPALLLGGGAALVADLLRGRARRERAQRSAARH